MEFKKKFLKIARVSETAVTPPLGLWGGGTGFPFTLKWISNTRMRLLCNFPSPGGLQTLSFSGCENLSQTFKYLNRSETDSLMCVKRYAKDNSCNVNGVL